MSVSAQVNAKQGMTISDYKSGERDLRAADSIRLSEGRRSSVENLTEADRNLWFGNCKVTIIKLFR